MKNPALIHCPTNFTHGITFSWAAVSKACICGHTPAPTQFTGCWVGYHRPQARGNGPEQDIDDNQWCAQNYNNFCQCYIVSNMW